MRTQEEILKRISGRKKRDILGFEWTEYVGSLTFENAKEFLKDDVQENDWKVETIEELKRRAIDYMDFAWEKANGCRGISAGRSLSHYVAWLWLLGEDDFDNIEDYQWYGKDELTKICEYFGLDSKKWDDGIRSNSEY